MEKPLDTAMTASVIAYNLFDRIRNESGGTAFNTHDKIAALAVAFCETHAEIEDWHTYATNQGHSDWEEYLVHFAETHFQI